MMYISFLNVIKCVQGEAYRFFIYFFSILIGFRLLLNYFIYQLLDDDVLWELEQIEKEADIDEILDYRSVAECEIEV